MLSCRAGCGSRLLAADLLFMTICISDCDTPSQSLALLVLQVQQQCRHFVRQKPP